MDVDRRDAAWRTWVPVAWVLLLALAVTAPTLAPGFVLSYDLVFTPRQDLLPASLGLDGGLPRAVPQDAVVALLTSLVPGMLLEKAVLLSIPVLSGLGMLRLLRDVPAISARLTAATLAVWSPFVAERLVIGHWGLLLAYAMAPWALASAVDLRRGRAAAGARLVLQVALGSLTPSGSLLLLALVVPIAVGPGSRASAALRGAVAAGSAALALPWILPALLLPSAPAYAESAADGAAVFGLRAEGPWGPLLTAVGLGGLWNADAVPDSRSWLTAPLLGLVLLGLAAAGTPALARSLGRAAATWLWVTALTGLLMAAASAVAEPAWGSLVGVSPALGLLRDAHKLLAPLGLLLSIGGGLGVAAALSRVRDRALRGALLALALVVPLAVLPDLAWGVGGRLVPVPYPAEWSAARQVLAEDPRPGDVVVLPWSAFRRFAWNGDRTVLDPAPRWLPRPSVVDDGLAVATPDGLVVVAGEDARAAQVSQALALGEPLAEVLPAWGIGWVLVEEGQASALPASPASLAGLEPVLVAGGLRLLATPDPARERGLPAAAPWVGVADLLVLVSLGAWGLAAIAWRERPHGRRSFGTVDGS
ncbi:MAG: hypothetical protein ACKOT0_05195 [bacterium]